MTAKDLLKQLRSREVSARTIQLGLRWLGSNPNDTSVAQVLHELYGCQTNEPAKEQILDFIMSWLNNHLHTANVEVWRIAVMHSYVDLTNQLEQRFSSFDFDDSTGELITYYVARRRDNEAKDRVLEWISRRTDMLRTGSIVRLLVRLYPEESSFLIAKDWIDKHGQKSTAITGGVIAALIDRFAENGIQLAKRFLIEASSEGDEYALNGAGVMNVLHSLGNCHEVTIQNWLQEWFDKELPINVVIWAPP